MIDEKKLIEDFMNNYLVKNDGTWNDAMDRAVELTKAAPKVGEWIPVSERLPEENGSYLCQINFANHEIIDVLFFATNLYKVDKWDFSDKKRAGFYDCEYDWGCFEVYDVIAWMPLPEPYRKDVE